MVHKQTKQVQKSTKSPPSETRVRPRPRKGRTPANVKVAKTGPNIHPKGARDQILKNKSDSRNQVGETVSNKGRNRRKESDDYLKLRHCRLFHRKHADAPSPSAALSSTSHARCNKSFCSGPHLQIIAAISASRSR